MKLEKRRGGRDLRVLITGASRGIGEGIARVLSRNGMRLGLLARSEDRLRSLADSLRAEGGQAVWAACDLGDPSCIPIAHNLIGEMGGVDALINNAGVVLRKDVLTIEIDEWRRMIDTNVNGVFYMVRAVAPAMIEQGRGHIINISSISGKVPLPGGSGYAASKYAVTGFGESILLELRDHGVKVTTIFPGSVDSRSDRHPQDADQAWKVQPEEVGETCLHILRTAPHNLISQVEIRPLRKPRAS